MRDWWRRYYKIADDAMSPGKLLIHIRQTAIANQVTYLVESTAIGELAAWQEIS